MLLLVDQLVALRIVGIIARDGELLSFRRRLCHD
jgi:hypothetical protein